jgi:hypothetical protein
MAFEKNIDSSDRLFRVTHPAEVRVKSWKSRKNPDGSPRQRVPVMHRPAEVTITCGSCGRFWNAHVRAKKVAELRYTEDGWRAQCPFCLTVNVYSVR